MNKKAEETKKPLSLKSLKAEMDQGFSEIREGFEQLADLIEGKQAAPAAGPMHRPEPRPEKKKDDSVSSYKYLFKARMHFSHGTGKEHPSQMRVVLKPSKRVEVDPINHDFELKEPIVADFGPDGPGPVGFWGTDEDELAEAMRAKIADERRRYKLLPTDPTEIEEIDVSRL